MRPYQGLKAIQAWCVRAVVAAMPARQHPGRAWPTPAPSTPKSPIPAWRLGLLLGLVLLASFLSVRAEVDYAYDEAGRLVQVRTATGSAQYRYDEAGNLLAVERTGASGLALADVAPNQAAVGGTVILTGAGFSATPGLNAVQFNGLAATVSDASATRLVVSVPNGATSGPVRVTVGGQTVTSHTPFVVTDQPQDAAPTVTALSTTLADVGSRVTLTGRNFVGTPNRDLWVRINGRVAEIVQATETSIEFDVPADTVGGYVTVGTRAGVAQSPSMLLVASNGLTAAGVGFASQMGVDEALLPIAGPPGKRVLVAFVGRAGQTLGLGVTQTTAAAASGYLRILAPDGSELLELTGFNSSGEEFDLPPLPRDGVYVAQLWMYYASVAPEFALTLSSDIVASVAVDGTVHTFETVRPGQNGRYRFLGTAGQDLSFLWTGATISSAVGSSSIVLYDPYGNRVDSLPFSSSTTLRSGTRDFPALPVTGTYTLFVDPKDHATGQVQFALLPYARPTLVVDGPPASASLTPGQNADFVFSGTAGQFLGLGVHNVVMTPTAVPMAITVLAPDGTTLVSCGSYSTTGGECDLPALPQAGDYVVRVNPTGSVATALQLTLSTDAGVHLNLGEPATTVSTPRIGQNGRATFDVPADQRDLTVVWTGATYPSSSTEFKVLGPDNAVLGTYRVNSSAGYVRGAADLGALQPGARYTLFVDPAGTLLGEVKFQVIPWKQGTLTIDGAPTTIAQDAGQIGDYRFSGTLGDKLGLGIVWSQVNSIASDVELIGPDGSQSTLTCEQPVAGNVGRECDLPVLPATGTYILRLNPRSADALQGQMYLSRDIVVGPAGRLVVQRPGQNGRHEFSAGAGASFVLNWSGATLNGAYSKFRLFAPDGKQVSSKSFTQSSGLHQGSFTATLPQQSGTYVLLIDTCANVVGQVDFVTTITAGVSPPVATEGDVPLPLWALLGLGGLLSAAGVWRRSRQAGP